MPELVLHCIRHGESVANAGGAMLGDADLSLTEHGQSQAEAVARIMAARPVEFIAISPYLRAQQTAAPTLAALPDIPHETWPDLREFSFLGKQALMALRPERLLIAQKYWNSANPDFLAGGTESFKTLIIRTKRILSAIEHLANRDITRACLFSHAYFLNALRWVMENPDAAITPNAMRDFIDKYKMRPIRNADILTFVYDGKSWKTGE